MRFELRIKTDPAIIVAFREEWPTGIWSSLVNLPFGFLDQSELAPLSRPSSGGRAFFWRFAEAHNVFLVMLREFSVVRCCIYWLQVHRGKLRINPILLPKNCGFFFCFSNSQCKSDKARSRCSIKSMHRRRVSGGIHMTGVLRHKSMLLMTTAALGFLRNDRTGGRRRSRHRRGFL
ncbi:Uncharacterised protein [Brucella anthropi]|nr:Uncharacterised protein [Brucella anthropi]